MLKNIKNVGENEVLATILFKHAQRSVESHRSGVVWAALVDGGCALESDVKSLPGVTTRRRCFAHCTRMGLTRGGGKRGGKGSLPRYLLDHGVKPKVMAKMMSLVLMMLWLPSKLEYEQAMSLFVNEFKNDINKHMAKTYLDPKHPENLGGHVAGHKATSSSTNGVERRGGIYKTKAKGITVTLPGSEKNNFIYVMEGMLSCCAIARNRTRSFSLDMTHPDKCAIAQRLQSIITFPMKPRDA